MGGGVNRDVHPSSREEREREGERKGKGNDVTRIRERKKVRRPEGNSSKWDGNEAVPDGVVGTRYHPMYMTSSIGQNKWIITR